MPRMGLTVGTCVMVAIGATGTAELGANERAPGAVAAAIGT